MGGRAVSPGDVEVAAGGGEEEKAAAIAAAPRIPECAAVATIGTPSATDHLRGTLMRLAPRALEDGVQEANVAGNLVRIGAGMIRDLENHDLRENVAALGRSLLILHSPADDFVSVDHAAALFRAAKHPKSFVSLDDADHLLLRDEKDARFVAGVVAAWAERYFCPTDG